MSYAAGSSREKQPEGSHSLIDQPDGVLPILTFDGHHGWDDLLQLGLPHLDAPGLKRLKAAVETTAKAVAVERHYIDKDYRETFSKYHSKKFHTPDARCIRLHFFRSTIDRDWLSKPPDGGMDQYLGYSVIRPIRPNCIGRTMLRPDARGGAAGMMCLCPDRVNLQGTDLQLSAFPFISQDADATVCAQATLWMLVRYFSNRYPIYPEVYPVQIGNLTRDYSVGRLFPTDGLYVWQMAEALRQINFASVIYSRSAFADSFDHLLYTYIESGIPVLAAFTNHVVVLFGHNSDYGGLATAAPPQGKTYIPSSTFCKGFVGNDDNGIPYQMLRSSPTRTQWEEMCGNSGFYSLSDVKQFVVPLPERVFLAAENAEKLMTTILSNPELGYGKLSPRIASVTPVLRLFLTTGKSFKRRIHMREQMGHPSAAAVYRALPLPHFVWVCEISDPSLYPGKVLGEVLWDATRNPYEHQGFLAVHYPEKIVVDWGSALNGEPDPTGCDLDNASEYPIYSSNLKEIP